MKNQNLFPKRFVFLLSFFGTFMLFSNLFSITSAALLPLLISPSARANGMGCTYTALMADDPMAVRFNPAVLGRVAEEYYFAASFHPVKTPWLISFVDDMSISTQTYLIGYNFQKQYPKFPMNIGLGYSRTYFDYGLQVAPWPDSPEPIRHFRSWDRSTDFSIGLCCDYFIKASAGITFKSIESNLDNYWHDNPSVKVNARDWGILIEMPFLQIVQRANFLTNSSKTFLPFYTPVFSYSVCNIGDKITYEDAAQADPLPRTANIGIGYEGGILKKMNGKEWKIISMKWAVEEEDLLIKNDQSGSWKYRTGLADIHPFNDLIRNRGNAEAFKHKGCEINLLDFFMLRKGRYEDVEGRVCYTTEGTGFSLSGIFKLIYSINSDFRNNILIDILANHLNIQYHTSSLHVKDSWHPLKGTEFKGMIITLR